MTMALLPAVIANVKVNIRSETHKVSQEIQVQ